MEHNRAIKKPTLDFNSILSWFGTFTPQFKNYLIAFQRTNPDAEFTLLATEIFQLFRKFLMDISRVPKGPERAEWVHKQLDLELQASEPDNISCKMGCGYCCHVEKQITDDEVELIHEYVEREEIPIDWKLLEEQSERYLRGEKWNSKIEPQNRCVYLNEENACSIYPARPGVCRKHRVTSPASECAKGPDGQISTDTQLLPEIVTSAALSLPDNPYGPMPVQLLKIRP